MEFHHFEMKDKEYINSFFGEHHYQQCDCSFNTLFLWQHAYSTMWAVEDNILFVRAGRGDMAYFMPPFEGKGAPFVHGLEIIKKHLDELGKPFRLMGASPWVVEQIKQLCPGKYEFEEDRDDFEYIYKTSDLIHLPGKKFRMKKNHLNGFLRTYPDYVYEPITHENMEEVKQASAEWFKRHGDIEDEEYSIRLCFDNWDALGVKGAIIRIYGKIEAFTIGDKMNDQVAHVHFEKANPEIRGLYQAINRDFILYEFADTEFVNREEDLGVPGLRQAKMEYNPDHFAEKYNVVLAGTLGK